MKLRRFEYLNTETGEVISEFRTIEKALDGVDGERIKIILDDDKISRTYLSPDGRQETHLHDTNEMIRMIRKGFQFVETNKLRTVSSAHRSLKFRDFQDSLKMKVEAVHGPGSFNPKF